jgi:hypothetical protein
MEAVMLLAPQQTADKANNNRIHRFPIFHTGFYFPSILHGQNMVVCVKLCAHSLNQFINFNQEK